MGPALGFLVPTADRVLPLMWPVTFTVGAMIHGAGSEDPPATCESGTEGRGAATAPALPRPSGRLRVQPGEREAASTRFERTRPG